MYSLSRKWRNTNWFLTGFIVISDNAVYTVLCDIDDLSRQPYSIALAYNAVTP